MRKAVSARLAEIGRSATLEFGDKAARMKREGVDVVDLALGSPDFDTPQHIVDAAIKALREGFTHEVSRGIPELREALAMRFKQDNNLEVNPDTDIIVSPGSKHAIFATIIALIDPGDEVLIPEPAWVSYSPMAHLEQGKPVSVPLFEEDNFQITIDKLREKLSNKTKMIVINTPNNPTGRVLTRQELQSIADLAIQNDLLVLSDEPYEKLVYGGRQHVSIAALPGMAERTLTTKSFSKSYSMIAWRLGCVAGNKEFINQILKVHEHSVSFAVCFVQKAGVAALTGSQQHLPLWIKEYEERMKLIADSLNRLPGISCRPSEGAFYAFPNISGTGMSSSEFAELMLTEAKTVVTPGIGFGACADGHVRIAFCRSSRERIKEGLNRMEKALAKRLG